MCTSDRLPVTNPRKARRRLWEIHHVHHCAILGTCLSLKSTRKILRKAGVRDLGGASDYEVHCTAVGLARRDGVAARLLDKALERAHQRRWAVYRRPTQEVRRPAGGPSKRARTACEGRARPPSQGPPAGAGACESRARAPRAAATNANLALSGGGGRLGAGPDARGRALSSHARLVPHLKRVTVAANARLLHHDGGIEDNIRTLPRLCARADIVLCPSTRWATRRSDT